MVLSKSVGGFLILQFAGAAGSIFDPIFIAFPASDDIEITIQNQLNP
jgi:hypothetical protein